MQSSDSRRSITRRAPDPATGRYPNAGFSAPVGQPSAIAFRNARVGSTLMGPQGALPVLTNNRSYSAPNIGPPSKRGRVDQDPYNVTPAQNRAPFAGNTEAQIAQMAQTPLGTMMRGPTITSGNPMLSRNVRNRFGASVAAGFPDSYSFGTAGQTPTGARQMGGLAWNGMPGKPTYFDEGRNDALSETATGNRFMGPGAAPAPRVGIPQPFANYNYDRAAANIENSSKTGKPNALIKYTHVLTRKSSEYCFHSQVAMPWFTSIALVDPDSQSSNSDLLGFRSHAPQHNGFNLVVANLVLACNQPVPESYDDVITAQDIMDEYKFLGFVAAEDGNGAPHVSSAARSVVFCMAGEISCFNFWGNVKYGQSIGFIYKGVNVEDIYAQDRREHGTYNINGTSPNTVRTLDTMTHTSCPIQIIPWHDKEGAAERPEKKDLAYFDSFGVLRYGKYFKVGIVIQVMDPYADDMHTYRAPYSLASAAQCGKIRVLADAFQDK